MERLRRFFQGAKFFFDKLVLIVLVKDGANERSPIDNNFIRLKPRTSSTLAGLVRIEIFTGCQRCLTALLGAERRVARTGPASKYGGWRKAATRAGTAPSLIRVINLTMARLFKPTDGADCFLSPLNRTSSAAAQILHKQRLAEQAVTSLKIIIHNIYYSVTKSLAPSWLPVYVLG